MPREQKEAVKKGVGSVTPTFTPPAVSVATPGLNQKAQPTKFEKFRDAVLLAGQSAAMAAQTDATISNKLKTLKEQAIARVERDQRLAAASIVRAQLEAATKARNDILTEGADKSPGWTEQRLRAGMTNANSVEEQGVWLGAWEKYRGLVKREDEQQEQMNFNAAARTAAQVANDLRLQIEEDPALKETLTGDGTGIGARVQDWVLAEAMNAAPNVFDLPSGATAEQEDNRDRIIHQLMEQSFSMGKALLKEYNGEVDQANIMAGTSQVGSDVYSALLKKQPPEMIEAQLDWTAERYFGSRAPELQRQAIKGTVQDSVMKMAAGSYGLDAIAKTGDLDTLLNVQFDGKPLYDHAEKVAIKAQAIAASANGFATILKTNIETWKSTQLVNVELADGSTVKRPSKDTDKLLYNATDPNESQIYKIQDQMFREMGLDWDTATTDQRALMTKLTGVVTQAVASGGVKVSKAERAYATARAWMQGAGNLTESEIVNGMDTTRATDAGYIMTAEETQELRADLLRNAEMAGIDKRVIEGWDGSAIVDFSEENRPLWEALALVEAERYNTGQQNNPHIKMPGAEIDRLENFFNSTDQGKIEYAARVISKLTSGQGGTYAEMYNHANTAEPMKAVMSYVKATSRFGEANIIKGTPEFNQEQIALVNMTNIAMKGRAVYNAGARRGFMEGKSEQDVEVPRFVEMADSLAEVWMTRAGSGIEDDFGRTSEAKAAIEAALQNGRGHAFEYIQDLWMSFKTLHTGLDNIGIASLVDSYLKADGYAFRENGNGEMVLMIDRWGYTGSDGDNLQDNFDKLGTAPFSPEAREWIRQPGAFGIKLQDGEGMQELANHYFAQKGVKVEGVFRFVQLPAFQGVDDRILRGPTQGGGAGFQVFDQEGAPLGTMDTRGESHYHMTDGSVYNYHGSTNIAFTPQLYRLDNEVYNPRAFADRRFSNFELSAGELIEGRRFSNIPEDVETPKIDFSP